MSGKDDKNNEEEEVKKTPILTESVGGDQELEHEYVGNQRVDFFMEFKKPGISFIGIFKGRTAVGRGIVLIFDADIKGEKKVVGVNESYDLTGIDNDFVGRKIKIKFLKLHNVKGGNTYKEFKISYDSI